MVSRIPIKDLGGDPGWYPGRRLDGCSPDRLESTWAAPRKHLGTWKPESRSAAACCSTNSQAPTTPRVRTCPNAAPGKISHNMCQKLRKTDPRAILSCGAAFRMQLLLSLLEAKALHSKSKSKLSKSKLPGSVTSYYTHSFGHMSARLKYVISDMSI